MDIYNGLTLYVAADLVKRLLGPTADYIGKDIQEWTERRLKNIGNIFSIAIKKLGDRIENSNESVPPKVFKGIIDEGQFCEDQLSAEYFGGVLASSSSEIDRDDRGASFISLIGRLSTYQIRSHYIIYSVIKKLFDGKDISIELSRSLRNMRVFMPIISYMNAMEFSNKENVDIIGQHVMNGLSREDLIKNYGFVRKELKNISKNIKGEGIICIPSQLGIELFLWAHGRSDLLLTDFFKKDYQFNFDIKVSIPPDSFIISEYDFVKSHFKGILE